MEQFEFSFSFLAKSGMASKMCSGTFLVVPLHKYSQTTQPEALSQGNKQITIATKQNDCH